MDAVTAMADALLVSGLSAFSFSAAAVAAAIALSEDADAAMTAVHGLSFFCYSVVEDAATTVYLATTAADVTAQSLSFYFFFADAVQEMADASAADANITIREMLSHFPALLYNKGV